MLSQQREASGNSVRQIDPWNSLCTAKKTATRVQILIVVNECDRESDLQIERKTKNQQIVQLLYLGIP